VNPDQWHGYPASRRRLIQFLRTRAAGDVVVLTGDIHSSWANELVSNPLDPGEYDPATGAGSVAVELVTPAITSPGLPPVYFPVVEAARPYNPHLRWFDLVRRGFLVVDITAERTQGAFYHLGDVTQPAPMDETFAAAWSVGFGKTRLVQDAAAAEAPPAAPAAP
jgi:alkaline phosphatase D